MGGLGRCVHTFRRGLFVKFRKSPHRTEKALRHAQKPANPRSANPIGPESTYVEPGKDPPMANPPQGPKNDAGEALPSHSRPLLRLAKVTQKRGFSQRFSDSFASGLRQFSGGFPAAQQRFCQRFSGGSTAVFRQFFQRFPGVFPAVRRRFSDSFSSGFPAVFRRFSSGFPAVVPAVLPAVFRRFDIRFCNWVRCVGTKPTRRHGGFPQTCPI